MTESLMTEATTTTEGSPESSTATESLLTNSEQVVNKQQSTEAQSQVTDQKGGQAGKAEAAQAPQGAPEKYEFTSPEGKQYDSEIINTYSDVAKQLNLNQKDAQKLLETVAPKLVERQAAQLDAIRTEWAESARNDKEYGGENLQENLGIAKKALNAFGTPELRTLLNESGLANNPEVIRFMYRAGKAMSEDNYVGNSSGSGARPGPSKGFNEMASALYTNQS